MSDGRLATFRRPDALDQIAAWMELVRQSKKTRLLFISHNMGGGCERHIQELGEYLREELEIITLRASGKKEAILHFGTRRKGIGLRFKIPGGYGELVKLCKYMAISRIHYHHLMILHPKIQDLPVDLDIPYDVTLHDYWFINTDPGLTEKKGYHTQNLELPGRICSDVGTLPDVMAAHKGAKNHARFLYQADRVIAPSIYTARIYRRHFPNLIPIVAYHPDREKCGPYPAVGMAPVRPGEFLSVAVLGALNREKGADILEETALRCKDRRFKVKFYLIGYGYRTLNKAVKTLGPYKESMLKHHIENIQPHVIWFPALSQETYSYTLSAALEAGKPVVASDMGTFSERLARRPLTWIKPCQTSGEAWAVFFDMLREMIFKGAKALETVWDDQPRISWNYKQNYKTPSLYLRTAVDDFRPDEKWIEEFIFRDLTNSKEKMLLWLIYIRCHPLMAKLFQKVPYHIERGIKRWFSRKPIHDIMQ
jgi:glycosyltransferase involved in cell wall biosynthesis